MAKSTKQKEVEITAPAEEKSFVIRSASINDGFCNYSYEIISGIGLGDTHKVTGGGIIDDDMQKAFDRLNVHLAALDDIFKHSGASVRAFDKMGNHELTVLFKVTGFQISGSEDNEAVKLIGTKMIDSSGEPMELKTPKIPIDATSSYKGYKELHKALTAARLEVELYRGGKYTEAEQEDPAPKFKQAKVLFGDGDEFNENDQVA